MVSSYTTNKNIEKPANGDYNNTWSTPVNSDWDVIDRAFGGTTTLNAVGASGTVALTVNQYQAPIIAINGALTANVNYRLPAGVGGFWFIFNNTSGSFSILFSSAGGGSTVTLGQGRTTAVICDGTNVGLADTSVPPAGGSTTQVQYNLSGQLAGSSGFVFDGSGNVGIGTASPTERLSVTGNISASGGLTLGTALAVGSGGTGVGTLTGVVIGTGTTAFTSKANPTGAFVGTTDTQNITSKTLTTGNTLDAGTAISDTGTIATTSPGFRGVPQNSKTASYVLALTDAGKHIYSNSAVTINASVFSQGDSFVIVNSNTATTSINITAGTGVILRLAGTTTVGSPRPVAPNGMASVLCVVGGPDPVFLVSGAGVF